MPGLRLKQAAVKIPQLAIADPTGEDRAAYFNIWQWIMKKLTARERGGRRASPKPADVDKDKMDSLLSRLSNMRAASFVESAAKTGLDAPAMTVAVKFDEGKKEERVTFGKADADAFAARPGEPGAAKIDTTDFNEATKTLDELAK